MIYILGMSHAISVLKALDCNYADTHENWNVNPEHPDWTELRTPDVFQRNGIASLKLCLIRPAMNWLAALQQKDGAEVLAASPGFWKLIESIAPGETGDRHCVVSFLGGNDHSIFSLVESRAPFDFPWPGDDRYPLIKGRQPVATRHIESHMEKAMNGTVAMLTALRFKHPRLSILHVMPPPPIASEAQIRSQPEGFGNVIRQYGITPISVRMKVYLVYCRLLAKVLIRLGAAPVLPPPDAEDSIGAMKEQYAFGCTHGNEAYGQLVAKQLLTELGKAN